MAKQMASAKRSRPAAGKEKPAAAPSAESGAEVKPSSGTIPAGIMKQTIAYFYLLSFCPPEKLGAFIRNTAPLRGRIAAVLGMEPAAYFTQAVSEVCRRIVAFHQATREPDADAVASLAAALGKADQNPESLAAFQNRMAEITALPARAGLSNRLLQDRGCRRCAAPCHFGFFVLTSNPQFDRLQELMEEESAKPAAAQSPLGPVLGFAVSHILDFTGEAEGFLRIADLANLSYCLLIWGMARSRVPLPEKNLRLFQAANQEFIRRSLAEVAAGTASASPESGNR
jgi:hypothetical protein